MNSFNYEILNLLIFLFKIKSLKFEFNLEDNYQKQLSRDEKLNSGEYISFEKFCNLFKNIDESSQNPNKI